jgi:ketopantoate reductase
MDAVHIVGCGGIGCAVGHALCAAGLTVTFVDADPAKIAWGRRNGVVVEGLPPRDGQVIEIRLRRQQVGDGNSERQGRARRQVHAWRRRPPAVRRSSS